MEKHYANHSSLISQGTNVNSTSNNGWDLEAHCTFVPFPNKPRRGWLNVDNISSLLPKNKGQFIQRQHQCTMAWQTKFQEHVCCFPSQYPIKEVSSFQYNYLMIKGFCLLLCAIIECSLHGLTIPWLSFTPHQLLHFFFFFLKKRVKAQT